MSTKELESKVRELRELKAMVDELNAEMAAIEETIKEYMGDTEELRAGEYKITWKRVASSRLDGKSLKAELPEIAERYTVTSEYRRFIVAQREGLVMDIEKEIMENLEVCDFLYQHLDCYAAEDEKKAEEEFWDYLKEKGFIVEKTMKDENYSDFEDRVSNISVRSRYSGFCMGIVMAQKILNKNAVQIREAINEL